MRRILNSPGANMCRYGDETEHLTGVIGLGISYAWALTRRLHSIDCMRQRRTNRQMAIPQLYPGTVEGVAEAIEVDAVAARPMKRL
jgi:hypothetical protein